MISQYSVLSLLPFPVHLFIYYCFVFPFFFFFFSNKLTRLVLQLISPKIKLSPKAKSPLICTYAQALQNSSFQSQYISKKDLVFVFLLNSK